MIDLPEGWATIRVADYFDSWGGMTPSTSNSSYWGGKVPWLSSKDIKTPRIRGGEESITQKALQETRLRLCPVGSVVVVVRSGILAHRLPIAIVDAPVSINQDLKAFYSPGDGLNEWLALALRALTPEILSQNRKDGTTVQSIRYEELCDLKIHVPPTDERNRIAVRVDQLLRKLEVSRKHLFEVPAILKRFRQAVLAAAASGRLTEDWRADHVGCRADQCLATSIELRKRMWEERIAERGNASKNGKKRTTKYVPPFEPDDGVLADNLPDGWVPATISQLAFLDVGFAFPSAGFTASGIRLLRGENVEPGSLRWVDVKCWPKDKVQAFKHLLVEEGESILAMDRPVVSSGLKLARVTSKDVPCLLVQRVMRFRVSFAPLANFLHLRLQTADFLRQVSGGLTGSDLPHITGTNVAEYTFGLPPLAEQQEICRRVSRLMSIADAIAERVGQAAARAEKLTQSILAKAFRGELVVTEAELARREGREYEPASVLLERIRAERSNLEKAPKLIKRKAKKSTALVGA